MERYIKKVWKALLLLLSLKGKLIPPVLFSSSAAPCSFLGFIAIETQSKGSLLLPPWDVFAPGPSLSCAALISSRSPTPFHAGHITREKLLPSLHNNPLAQAFPSCPHPISEVNLKVTQSPWAQTGTNQLKTTSCVIGRQFHLCRPTD